MDSKNVSTAPDSKAITSDVSIRGLKPKAKLYRVRCVTGGGLCLEVAPSGGKLWRMRYLFEGKEKMLSLGAYPAVSLADARQRRDEARKLLANGVDPGEVKKAQKVAKAGAAANSFEVIAREWFATWGSGKASAHSEKVIARLERDAFPYIGGKPVTEITAPLVLSVLRRIEARGIVETAHRTKGNISQVMRYAIATGRAERDPCPDLRGALQSYREKRKHFAALITPAQVGELLRAFDGFNGSPIVRVALLLSPLVFVRPGELRQAEWAHIDLERGEWRYLVSKTKTEHLVPLSRQAVTLLQELQPLTGHGRYVFPGARDHGRPMSGAAVNAALKRMGYDTQTEITGHGFRAMARTLLAEELHQQAEVIEHQLAHKVPDALGTAYNRTRFIKERITMMQAWADYLDVLKVGGKVIPLRPAA